MILEMNPGATSDQLSAVISLLEAHSWKAVVSTSGHGLIVGVEEAAHLDDGELHVFQALDGIAAVYQVTEAHRLVSSTHRPTGSTIRVGTAVIGPQTQTLIAGPCAVENYDQTLEAARLAKSAGASILRGGCFKPRTSPYSFQGHGKEALEILQDVARSVELPAVTEVVHPADVALVSEYADALQIGARNSQNYSLLSEAGASGKPILLKRGFSATVDEWLLAAEYIAHSGNMRIILCERGIRTFEPRTRNTLDVSAVAIAARETHLPVIVDPSHSGGRRELVIPLARAGLAAGASGLIVDIHPRPEEALCDGQQALTAEDIPALERVCRDMGLVMGRTLQVDVSEEFLSASASL